MAAIDPQAAIDAAQPWCCVPQGDLWLAVLGALIRVSEGNPMPTTNELMADIACLRCAVQPGDVPLLILGAVDAIAGGGGGGGGQIVAYTTTGPTADGVLPANLNAEAIAVKPGGSTFIWNSTTHVWDDV